MTGTSGLCLSVLQDDGGRGRRARRAAVVVTAVVLGGSMLPAQAQGAVSDATRAAMVSQVYSTPGISEFTVPEGVTTVKATVLGAGGSGGGADGHGSEFLSHYGGGGGGGAGGNGGNGGNGGGAAQCDLTVEPGQVLTPGQWGDAYVFHGTVTVASIRLWLRP